MPAAKYNPDIRLVGKIEAAVTLFNIDLIKQFENSTGIVMEIHPFFL